MKNLSKRRAQEARAAEVPLQKTKCSWCCLNPPTSNQPTNFKMFVHEPHVKSHEQKTTRLMLIGLLGGRPGRKQLDDQGAISGHVSSPESAFALRPPVEDSGLGSRDPRPARMFCRSLDAILTRACFTPQKPRIPTHDLSCSVGKILYCMIRHLQDCRFYK